MKIIFLMLSAGILLTMFSCNSGSGDSSGKDTTVVAGPPKTVLKTTKQYKTNLDGNVETIMVNVEIAYNDQEVCVKFADDSTKNLVLKVTGKTQDSSGTKLTIDDRKYQEVFITSGKEPQIRLSTVKGTENCAFM